MSERVNPFGSLDDFSLTAPKPKPGPDELDAINQVAEQNGFLSRQPPKASPPVPPAAAAPRVQRRHTTGRNQQLNIKATAVTVEKFYRLADEHGVPLGEILARALESLERDGKK